MTGALSPTHWVIILVVVLLVFGGKRLPDAARGLGRSLRIFKAETASLTKGDEESRDESGHASGDAEPVSPATGPTASTPASTPVSTAPEGPSASERAA